MYLVFGVGALFAREKCKLWQRSTVVSSREEGTPGLGASHLPLICLTAHELGAPGQPGRRERPCVLVGRGGTLRILSRVFEGSGPGCGPADRPDCCSRGDVLGSNQADRDLIGSSHQQEDLQEDGQDPGTSVCAVILSTNQLGTFLWRMDEFFNGVEAYIHSPQAHS